MRFAVVADTHVRPEHLDPGDFAANGSLAGRNRHMVELLNRLAPAFVIHLGDVVHPVPGDPHHTAANVLAAAAYEELTMPMYVVPGNHDVGDKPFPWVDAPKAAEEHYAAFEVRWGRRRHAFIQDGCRFVLVDTPILGTGTDAEDVQWRWLETVLGEAGERDERIFLFGHYPPYLWHRDEEEHYDNLSPVARARLLDLVERHGVEAVFSGHVHRFFHRRHGETDLYVLPAVGFVRPGYSEFDAVAPRDQFGRDDRGKLGFFVVDVDDDRHVVRPVRTWGRTGGASTVQVGDMAPRWRTHVGVTFRHGWALPKELVMGGLDEFTRKRARDDAPVLALWEARISDVRIPAADVSHPDARSRVQELAAGGVRFTVIVPGVEALARVPATGAISRWEVVLAPGEVWDERVPRPPSGTVAVGPMTPWEGPDWNHEHFVSHGFGPDVGPGRIQALAGDADEVVFRVGPDMPIWEAVDVAAGLASACGFEAVILVELPRRSEGRLFDDDAVVANRLVEAEICARTHPELSLFVDGFADHDRGYFPRVGLVNRRSDPRPSFGALVSFAREGFGSGRLVASDASVRIFEGDGWRAALVSVSDRFGGVWRSLLDGRETGDQLDPGPWLAVEGV